MITREQIKAARALLGWNAEDLAKHAGVSVATIRRLEAKGGSLSNVTIGKYDGMTSALRDAGVTFLNEQPGTLGVCIEGPSSVQMEAA